jgi:hypothetical protein
VTQRDTYAREQFLESQRFRYEGVRAELEAATVSRSTARADRTISAAAPRARMPLMNAESVGLGGSLQRQHMGAHGQSLLDG